MVRLHISPGSPLLPRSRHDPIRHLAVPERRHTPNDQVHALRIDVLEVTASDKLQIRQRTRGEAVVACCSVPRLPLFQNADDLRTEIDHTLWGVALLNEHKVET